MTGAEIQFLDRGRMRVALDFLPVLRASGLNDFGVVMALQGDMMRAVPGRSTVRVQLRQPDGQPCIAFLKRYEPDYLTRGKRLLRWLHWPGAGDEALCEWNAIRALRAAGFSTAQPIALGQQRGGGIVQRSFLLTAEIQEGVAAHDHLRTLCPAERRQLAREIGLLARRFHQAGFAHRDFYLSHVFVVPSTEGTSPEAVRALNSQTVAASRPSAASLGPDSLQRSAETPPHRDSPGRRELLLIDLQRLFRPRFFRRRWIVKDLAQLGYTAQLAGARRTDLMRFYHAYADTPRLRPEDKPFLRWVARRIAALHARQPKYDVIWNQPGVRPPNV